MIPGQFRKQRLKNEDQDQLSVKQYHVVLSLFQATNKLDQSSHLSFRCKQLKDIKETRWNIIYEVL